MCATLTETLESILRHVIGDAYYDINFEAYGKSYESVSWS